MRNSRTTPVPEGRTRWRRFSVATSIVTALAAGLVYLTASGAIAVSLQISGIPFKLSASNLSGNDFVQYATVDAVSNHNSGLLLQMAGVSPDASQTVDNEVYDAATVTVLSSAAIENLHQTVCAPIPGMSFLPKNKLLVTIDAGRSAGEPVTAENMVVDAPLMNAGSATFTNIFIGQDLGKALGGDASGNFSQQADHVEINNLHQVAIATTAGRFRLTGLTVSATFTSNCP
jgi:hypothetical protein